MSINILEFEKPIAEVAEKIENAFSRLSRNADLSVTVGSDFS